jgi:glycosyltransferase involved in cell wall biosynthesis
MGLTIVQVLSSFGLGGQERIALDLATGFRDAGHRPISVSLAEDHEGPLGAEFRARGLEVEHIRKQPGFDTGLYLTLGRLYRRAGADVVHTHNPQPLIYGGPPARLVRAALIHTKHGINPDTDRRKWLKRAVGRLPARFVAVSQPTADVARDRHECPANRIRVIPNGIDLSRFGKDEVARREVRDELGLPRDAWVVGTVGRLWPEKGHPYLLKSLEPLLSPSFHVVIAGDGPEADSTAALVRSLARPSSVHLLGPRHDIPRIFAALDTFVLSSMREGLPLVIPEAMASGLPVVSTAVGGIPQVVEEGRSGFLVDYGDEEAMRAAISKLDRDRALAEEFGRVGRAAALDRYSSQRMVDDYLALYHDVVRS